MSGNISAGHSPVTPVSSSSDRVNHGRQLLRLLMETERTIHRDPDSASTYLDQAIAMLAVDKDCEPSPNNHRGGLARWQISRVDAFIKEQIDQCIRIAELAALLSLSVSHFSHAFKQSTGMTPLMYVAAIRIEAAQQYMLCSSHSLSDVALRHGFCDQSHFCRVFRRQTGLSPQIWRKLRQGPGRSFDERT